MRPTVSFVRAAEYFVVVMTTIVKRRLGMRARIESIDVIVEIREEEGYILEGRETHIRSNNVGGHTFIPTLQSQKHAALETRIL